MPRYYKSYLELVESCNRVVDDSTRTSYWKPLDSNRAVAERELTKLVLRNDKREHQTFGYLTYDVVHSLLWTSCGVWEIERDSSWDDGDAHVYGFQEDGHTGWLNIRLTRMVRSRVVRENFPFLHEWGNGSEGPGDFFSLVGRPKDIKIPDYLTLILGIVQREVHLTIYVQTQDDILVWVQNRPDDALLYPGMLDHAASGVIKHGETESYAINRLLYEDLDGGRGQAYKVKSHKPISYFTIRPEEAGQLKGLPEAGMNTYRSIKVNEEWVPRGIKNGYEVGKFTLLTLDEVKDSLLNGEWKPSSALSMVRFLADTGAIPGDEVGVEQIRQKLYRQLPHWLSPIIS